MGAVPDAEPTCTIDPQRPCRSCLAPGPWACPYPYLLADEDWASPPGPAGADAASESAERDRDV